MVRTVGLDYHISSPLSPSGPPGRLHQKLKGALGAAVVRRVQGQIRRHDSHQGHIPEIVALHNHLGSDQNICLSAGKGRENLFMASLF